MGGETIPSQPFRAAVTAAPPLRAATAAKPGSIKMKSSVSGFLWNEPAVPGEPGGTREMKGFWNSATSLRRWMLLEMEKQQQEQTKDARRAGPRRRDEQPGL